MTRPLSANLKWIAAFVFIASVIGLVWFVVRIDIEQSELCPAYRKVTADDGQYVRILQTSAEVYNGPPHTVYTGDERECRDECSKRSDCNFFTWEPSRNYCFFHAQGLITDAVTAVVGPTDSNHEVFIKKGVLYTELVGRL